MTVETIPIEENYEKKELTREERREEARKERERKTALFIEKHRNVIEEMRKMFHVGDYETFLRLPEALRSFGKLYEVENPDLGVELPTSILENVVTSEYVSQHEAIYKNLSPEEGLYIPLVEKGGGDFWLKQGGAAGVGRMAEEENPTQTVEFLDMAGHSRDAAVMKAFLARLIELYHTRYPAGYTSEKPHLLSVLDAFLTQCPFSMPYAEYTEMHITDTVEDEIKIEIERAGGQPVFMRDWVTGQVTLIEEDPTKGHTVLGTGDLTKNKDEQGGTTVATHGADVYICSDGVFDILLDPEDKEKQFRHIFPTFCADRISLSPEKFRQEFFAYIDGAKAKNCVNDDVTVLVIPVGKHKT